MKKGFLIYTIITVLATLLGFLFPLLLCVALLMWIPVILAFIKFLLKFALRGYAKPFLFVHQLLTNTFPGGKNCDDYGNICYSSQFQLVVFGVFGNTLYYALVTALIFLIFAFRPYGDGYIYKQTDFSVDSEIVIEIDNEKEVAIVKNCEQFENGGVLVTADFNGRNLQAGLNTFDGIKKEATVVGAYIENDDATFVHFCKSAWNWIKYVSNRFHLVVSMLLSDM